MSIRDLRSKTGGGLEARTRLDSLTGLRFLAAFMVFGLHIAPFFQQEGLRPFARLMLEQGYAGVSFFFVLSGFVLTWSWRKNDTPGRFYRRRIARIYPNHVVTFLFVAALVLYRDQVLDGLSSLANLFLVHAWFPSPGYYNAMNRVSWSLSCEMFFYAAFPMVLPVVARQSARARRAMLPIIIAAVFVVPFAFRFGPFDPSSTTGLYRHEWIVYFFPLTRVLEFLAGIILAHEVLDGRWPRIRLRTALGLALAAYVAAALPGLFPNAGMPHTMGWVSITLIPFMLLIAAAAQTDRADEPSRLRGKWMVRLGEISFAFYLVHGLILQSFGAGILASVADNPVRSVLAAIAILAICIAVSTALRVLIERPLEKKIRNGHRTPRSAG